VFLDFFRCQIRQYELGAVDEVLELCHFLGCSSLCALINERTAKSILSLILAGTHFFLQYDKSGIKHSFMNCVLTKLSLQYCLSGMKTGPILSHFSRTVFNEIRSFRSFSSFYCGCASGNLITQRSSFIGYLDRVFCLYQAENINILSANAVFKDVVFQSKTSTGDGGAIYVSADYGVLDCSNCLFRNCSCVSGGGLYSLATKSIVNKCCFDSCVGSLRGQSFYVLGSVFNCSQVNIFKCSYYQNSGRFTSYDIFNALTYVSNLNCSHCYVSVHVSGLFINSAQNQYFDYINIDSCDSPECATLDFQGNPSVCDLKFGNVINCPIRLASYGLIFTYYRSVTVFYDYVFFNNTGYSYCVQSGGSVPSFYRTCFDCQSSNINSAALYSCSFNTKSPTKTLNAPKIENCYIFEVTSYTRAPLRPILLLLPVICNLM